MAHGSGQGGPARPWAGGAPQVWDRAHQACNRACIKHQAINLAVSYQAIRQLGYESTSILAHSSEKQRDLHIMFSLIPVAYGS